MSQPEQVYYFQKDYHTRFDTLVYFKRFLEDDFTIKRAKHFLRCLHNDLQSLPTGLSVLDYGSGPSILTGIPAATKASEIVFSDYTEGNRTFIRQWINNTTSVLDWSMYFRYVVEELEGKAESDIAVREEQVRKLTKAVVSCDLTQDPPVESGYDRQYDVVVANLVVATASFTQENYRNNIAKLGKLVKPGGTLIIYDAERTSTKRGFYIVGDAKFSNVSVTSDFVCEALESAGFFNFASERYALSCNEGDDPTFWGFFYLCGRKQP